MSSVLTVKDLKKVRDLVFSARVKWYDIGLELNIDPGTLDSIRYQYQDPKDCLTEMLKEWLKNIEPLPTYKGLAKALSARAVRETALAKEGGWIRL